MAWKPGKLNIWVMPFGKQANKLYIYALWSENFGLNLITFYILIAYIIGQLNTDGVCLEISELPADCSINSMTCTFREQSSRNKIDTVC